MDPIAFLEKTDVSLPLIGRQVMITAFDQSIDWLIEQLTRPKASWDCQRTANDNNICFPHGKMDKYLLRCSVLDLSLCFHNDVSKETLQFKDKLQIISKGYGCTETLISVTLSFWTKIKLTPKHAAFWGYLICYIQHNFSRRIWKKLNRISSVIGLLFNLCHLKLSWLFLAKNIDNCTLPSQPQTADGQSCRPAGEYSGDISS